MRKPWPTGKQSVVFRSAAGWGDSIYAVAIVNELRKQFPEIIVRTRHPHIFSWMHGVLPVQWSKHGEDIAIHYSGRKQCPETNQFQDLLFACCLPIDIEFRIDWKVMNKGLIERMKAAAEGKRICIVAAPHTVFGRRDGYGAELTPKWDGYQAIIDAFKHKLFFVQVGLIREVANFRGIGMDLIGKVSDTDTLDLATSADCVLGQHGYSIPLAEAFAKPLFVIYSRRGLNSHDPYIKFSTAQKTNTRSTSHHAVDDEPIQTIIKKAGECYGLPFQ